MLGREVYVVDAVRTPFGRHGGALAGVRPDDLATVVVQEVVARTAGLDPARVDEVVLGAANQSGEDNRNVARMAVLLAGWPTSVTATTINRLCASSLDAVTYGARAIAVGEASVVVAGGVESMTRAPWVLPKPDRAFPRGDGALASTTLGWRLVNPALPQRWTLSLGESTEVLAERYGIGREAADGFAARSQSLAATAWADGAYDAQVVQVPDAPLERDEGIRDGVTTDTLAGLRPVFRPDGVVTAGNASQLSDGAAAVLLADADTVAELGVEPLARVRASATHGVDPEVFGIAPVQAVRRCLERADRSLADVDVVELNEAFGAQAVACLRQWPELDPERVNPLGGAIAMGHPLGASGARLAGALAWQLSARGGGLGVAALCIGVGQGMALVLES